jgi:hypothetical protein
MDLQAESPGGVIAPTISASLKTPFSITALDEGFTQSDAVYPCSPLPVHERWTAVLAWFPAVREHGMFHDYTDEYKKAYSSGDAQLTYATLEMCALQLHFFNFIMVNNLTFRHVAYMHWLTAQVWQHRLGQVFSAMVDKKRETPRNDPPERMYRRPRRAMH